MLLSPSGERPEMLQILYSAQNSRHNNCPAQNVDSAKILDQCEVIFSHQDCLFSIYSVSLS